MTAPTEDRKPRQRFKREDVLRLLEAVGSARFALHCELLGQVETVRRGEAKDADEKAKEDGFLAGMNVEALGEVLSNLQAALRPFYSAGVPKICPGCSPLNIERHGFNESYDPSQAKQLAAQLLSAAKGSEQ